MRLTPTQQEWRFAKARTIFALYLDDKAALQCNVSFDARVAVQAELSAAQAQRRDVSVTAFDNAVFQVMEILAHGLWVRACAL